MSNSRKIAANTLYQILGKLSTALSTLVVTILLTRYLGPIGFGEYTIVFAYIFSFLIIGDFGINSIVVRDFSKDEKRVKDDFISVLGLRVTLSIIVILLAILLLPIFPYSLNVKKAIVLGTILIFGHSIGSSCNIIFQTFLKYKFQFFASVISGLSQVLLVGIAVFLKSNFFVIVGAVVAGSLLLPISSLIFSRKYISFRVKLFRSKYWKKIFTLSMPVGVGLIFNTLLTKEDITIMLPWLASVEAVGLYSIGNKLFENLLTFPNSFMNVVFPLFVRDRERSKEKLEKTIQLSFDSLVLLGLPLIFEGIVLAPKIILLVGGEKFLPGVLSFRVLLISSLVFFVSPLYRWLIIVLDKQNKLPIIYGTALLVDFFLNLIFIPKFGILGAAFVTGISETVVLVILFYLTFQYLKFLPKINNFLKGALSVIAMSALLILIKDLSLIVTIPVGLGIYLISLYILGIFNQPAFKSLLPSFKS